MTINKSLTLAERAISLDLKVERGTNARLTEAELSRLARHLGKYQFPLVYTAFDGDHFAFTSEMRRYCISHDVVPVDPESVLGYYETVTARLTKRGVLKDDLAILRGCDQIWVFTDVPPSLAHLNELAEGVLIELLFFVLAREEATIAFVPLTPLLQREKPDPVVCGWTAQEFMGALEPRFLEDALGYLGGQQLSIVAELPRVWYAIADLLDSKYYRWIRKHALGRNDIAVVPGLAIGLGDTISGSDELGCLLVSWSHLMKLATRSWFLEPMDQSRGVGNIQEILHRQWSLKSAGPLKKLSWQELGVPKVVLGEAWRISEHGG